MERYEEYRAVSTYYSKEIRLIRALMFSTESREWSESSATCPWPLSRTHYYDPYLWTRVDSGGTVYWVEREDMHGGVVALDPFAATWYFIDSHLGTDLNKCNYTSALTFRGHLRLFSFSSEDGEFVMRVWELTGDDEWHLVCDRREVCDPRADEGDGYIVLSFMTRVSITMHVLSIQLTAT